MSTEKSTTDSSVGSLSSSDSVSRRELEIRLQLKELATVQLRRRLTRLKDIHDLDFLDETETMQSATVSRFILFDLATCTDAV